MKIRSAYLWITIGFLILALAGIAYLGTFTRFHADDFCMATDAAQIGLTGMLAKWYTTWTGRYMFILSTGFMGLGGPGFAGWLPALAETLWLAGISWAILPLIRRANWPHPKLLSVAIGALGLVVLLSSTPNLFQSFYWQDGLGNYTLPLIGLTFSCGLILRVWLQPTGTWGPAMGVFVLSFLSGGFTEAYSALQVALFAIGLGGLILLRNRRRWRSLLTVLTAALAGGVLAMLIVVIAPGNQVRQGLVGTHTDLVRIVTFSMRNAAFIIGKYFIKTPIWAFFSLSLPFLAGWLFIPAVRQVSSRQNPFPWWRQSWFGWIVVVWLATFALVTAACAPVVYALNAYPDDRTIIIPYFVIISAVICTSALLGMGLSRHHGLPDLGEKPAIRRAVMAGMAIIILTVVSISTWQTVSQAPDYQAYAQAWDLRAKGIQDAAVNGESDLTVVGLNARFGVADLDVSPDYWVNRCMANYYHLNNISGK
jgi:hypothetical protein